MKEWWRNYGVTALSAALLAIAIAFGVADAGADTTADTVNHPICTTYEQLQQCRAALARTPLDQAALNHLFNVSEVCVFNTPGTRLTVLDSKLGGYRHVRLYGPDESSIEAWTVADNVVRTP